MGEVDSLCNLARLAASLEGLAGYVVVSIQIVPPDEIQVVPVKVNAVSLPTGVYKPFDMSRSIILIHSTSLTALT